MRGRREAGDEWASLTNMPTGGMRVINWPMRQLMKKKLAIIVDVVELDSASASGRRACRESKVVKRQAPVACPT
jgi:hypothetical protein